MKKSYLLISIALWAITYFPPLGGERVAAQNPAHKLLLKRFYSFLLMIAAVVYLGIAPNLCAGQNIAINTTGTLPDSSAGLDIDFSDKGLLIPRVALTATNSNAPIGAGIVTSLLAFNTATVNDVTPGYYYWNGTAWVRLLNIGSSAGTTDYLARWTSATDLGIGISRDNGTYVGIGSAPNSNYRLFVATANGAYDGIYGEHTSGAAGSVFNAVSGKIVNGAYTTAQGYLAYHVSNNNTYAVYGKGGNWAGYFDNKVVIGNATPGTINTGDLEVQNTTAGSGNAATLTLRQTTSNTTSGNILSNINFGDNYQASPQAQIQSIRGAASSGVTDLPTDILFYNINDDSTALTERMRIKYSGNVGIGTAFPSERLEVRGNTRIGQSPTALTTLSAAILSTDVTAPVVSTAGYPSTGTLIIGSWPTYEMMSYTSTTATTFNGLTRGILGTTAAGWPSGSTVNVSLASFTKTSSALPAMVVTGSGSTYFGGTPGPVYASSPGVVEVNPTGSFAGIVLRNDPTYGLYFTNNMGTGNKIMMNGAGALTSGTGIYMGGGIANATTGFSGSFIRIEPSRTATATINDNGNFIRLTRSYSVNNGASTYTISGDLMTLTSNITQTAGTGIDNSSILSLNQAFVNASGAVLEVINAGVGNIGIMNATNTGANGLSVQVQSSASGQYAFQATSNGGATTGLYVRADGNVGIGTTTPNYKLDINLGSSQVQATGNGTNGNGYQITNTDVSSRSWALWALGNSGLYGEAKSFAIYDQTAGATRLLISTAGNVGIGTNIPSAQLHVQNNQNAPTQIWVRNTNVGASATAEIEFISEAGDFVVGTGSNAAWGNSAILWNVANTSMLFATNSIERMRIRNTGNVGIGTTGPNSKFQVEGGAMYTSTAGEGLILKSPDGLTCRKVTIDNSGVLTLTPVACP